MKRKEITFLSLFILVCFSVNAQKYTKTDTSIATKTWKGNTFSSSKTFVENITDVAEFTQLVKALEKGKTIQSIEKEEMVTIFAISNKGFVTFKNLQDSIPDPSKKAAIKEVLTYHIIPGRVDSHSLKIATQKGTVAYFSTVQGENLGVKEENGQLFLVDKIGNTSLISATDFYHTKGFFHIVDGIVLPETKD